MKHKFRAWDTDREMMIPNVAVGDGFLWEIYPDGGGEELDPETHIVMPYSWERDSYGAVIAAGDIIECCGKWRYEVYCDESTACFAAKRVGPHRILRKLYEVVDDSFVIAGNIYENHKLLKGTK